MASIPPTKKPVSFRRGAESFHVGEVVEVEADGEELPFVGEILARCKKRKNFGEVVRVRWYYRKDEVKGGSAAWMGKKEFFKGKFHTDEIAVAAVNRKLPLRFVRNAEEWRKEYKDSPFVRFDYDAKGMTMDFGSGWPLDPAGHPANPDTWAPKRSARLPVAPWPEYLLAKATPQKLRELESLGVGDIVKHGMTRSAPGSAANSDDESDSDSASSSDAPSPTPEQKAAREAEEKAAAARAARLARRRSSSGAHGDDSREDASGPAASAHESSSSAPAAPGSSAAAQAKRTAAKADDGMQSVLSSPSSAPQAKQAARVGAAGRGTKRARTPRAQRGAAAGSSAKASRPSGKRGDAQSEQESREPPSPVGSGSGEPQSAPMPAPAPPSPAARSRDSASSGGRSLADGAPDTDAPARQEAQQRQVEAAAAAITPVDLLQWLFPRARQQSPVHAPAAAAAAATEDSPADSSAEQSAAAEESTLLSLRPFVCPTFAHATQVMQRASSSGPAAAVLTGFTSTSTTPTSTPVDEQWQALCNQQAATRIIRELHGRLLAAQYHRAKADAAAAAAVGSDEGTQRQQERAAAVAAAAKYKASEALLVKHMKQQLHLIPAALRPAFAAVCDAGHGGADLPSVHGLLPTPAARSAPTAAPPPGSVRSYTGSVASAQSAAVSAAQTTTGSKPFRRSAAVLPPAASRSPAQPAQPQHGGVGMHPAVYSTNAPLTGYGADSGQPFPHGGGGGWMGQAQAPPPQYPGMAQTHTGFNHTGYEHASYPQTGGYSASYAGGGYANPGTQGYATGGGLHLGAPSPPVGYAQPQGAAYPAQAAFGQSYVAFMKQQGYAGQRPPHHG